MSLLFDGASHSWCLIHRTSFQTFKANKVFVSQAILDALSLTPVHFPTSARVCTNVFVCAYSCLCVCEGRPVEVPGSVEICTSHRFTLQQVVYSEHPSNQPLCTTFSAMISSKRSPIEHKQSPAVSQIALTSKSELSRVMSPHFSTVTVTIHFATSVLHSAHMMQEGVRLLFTSLRSAV